MSTFIGIWLDHKKAYLFSMKDNEESLQKIESQAESKIRQSGGSRSKTPYAPQDVGPERKLQQKRKLHLHTYYHDIIQLIKEAEKVYLFGPGEAKFELEKELKKVKKLQNKIAKIDPADRMTQKQIAAQVRKFFAHT